MAPSIPRGMTTVAYVVLSHRAPEQVARLVRRLLDGSDTARVLLHHDPTGTPLPPRLLPARVERVVPARPVRWGDAADVLVFRDALAQAAGADWTVFLSGQDYPVRPVAEIEADLATSPYDVLMELLHADDAPWPDEEAVSRYYYRYVRRPRGSWLSPVSRAVAWRRSDPEGRRRDRSDRWRAGRRLVSRTVGETVFVGWRPRRTPFGERAPLYIGSQWFSVSRRGSDLLRNADDPALLRHMARTILPDESYFQTLVGRGVPAHLVGPNLRYIQWDAAAAHPRPVTLADLPAIEASGAHFARKFDAEADSDVLDALDHDT
jgi:hypothetical protein